jgi:hypothetical protein
MPTADAELRRVTADFERFLVEPKPEHVDLFLPVIELWRSHFPDGGGERTLDMQETLQHMLELPTPLASNVRAYLHAGGGSFTVAFRSLPPGHQGDGIPICMIVSVADGRITRFEEYVDNAPAPAPSSTTRA